MYNNIQCFNKDETFHVLMSTFLHMFAGFQVAKDSFHRKKVETVPKFETQRKKDNGKSTKGPSNFNFTHLTHLYQF